MADDNHASEWQFYHHASEAGNFDLIIFQKNDWDSGRGNAH